MTTISYRYVIENANRVCRDVSADEAEEVRTGRWQGAMDLEDGDEFATGNDENGQPVTVYRIAE